MKPREIGFTQMRLIDSYSLAREFVILLTIPIAAYRVVPMLVRLQIKVLYQYCLFFVLFKLSLYTNSE